MIGGWQTKFAFVIVLTGYIFLLLRLLSPWFNTLQNKQANFSSPFNEEVRGANREESDHVSR